MNKPAPIFLEDLLYKLDLKLIELLKNLSSEDWNKPTLASQWSVKDVAAHLLDSNLRSLSLLRDGHFAESKKIDSYSDLVSYLNQLNSDWVQAMKRLSPNVIIELLENSGKQYCDFIMQLPPFEKALFSVAWAGENESLNWFHVAREYTEKWHHQQQIRHAVGREELLMKHNFFYPYLDTSVRALPYHYRNTKGQPGDIVSFKFVGDQNYEWLLVWEKDQWHLYSANVEEPITQVVIKNEISWKIFTKGISRDDALDQSEIIGKKELGIPIFNMIAVMA